MLLLLFMDGSCEGGDEYKLLGHVVRLSYYRVPLPPHTHYCNYITYIFTYIIPLALPPGTSLLTFSCT